MAMAMVTAPSVSSLTAVIVAESDDSWTVAEPVVCSAANVVATATVTFANSACQFLAATNNFTFNAPTLTASMRAT